MQSKKHESILKTGEVSRRSFCEC